MSSRPCGRQHLRRAWEESSGPCVGDGCRQASGGGGSRNNVPDYGLLFMHMHSSMMFTSHSYFTTCSCCKFWCVRFQTFPDEWFVKSLSPIRPLHHDADFSAHLNCGAPACDCHPYQTLSWHRMKTWYPQRAGKIVLACLDLCLPPGMWRVFTANLCLEQSLFILPADQAGMCICWLTGTSVAACLVDDMAAQHDATP